MHNIKLTLFAAYVLAVSLIVGLGEVFAADPPPQTFTLKPITLGVACGPVDLVTAWLAKQGESPKVVFELDGGFSGFLTSTQGNDQGTVFVVNPAGEACMLFRGTELNGADFLYGRTGFSDGVKKPDTQPGVGA
ncbi:MAG: hypothetical protein GY899_11735 [Verrucomicrobiaceae bacterium]|nr:hypothetical protein [Verrucomicrobiaceae bacterium]